MAREWKAICKDCGKEFGYSYASYQASRARGLSRPERCPRHRVQHSREIRTLGLSHYELRPVRPIDPSRGLLPGLLGALSHPPRIHDLEEIPQDFDFSKFGITDDDIRRLFSVMRRHQVTVVVGPTGSGKSTFLPYRLMVPPPGEAPDTFTRYGQIIVTQPRIQATRNIPDFVATRLHGSSLGPGFDVGFRHSNMPATDWRNKLVYVTDGTLINWIVTDQIGKFSVIMIDEAHERSLNIDLILGLLKAQLPRYPHLKLIVASATIDADRFVDYYGGSERVGHVEFKGKEPRWLLELKEKPPIDKYGGPYYEVRFRKDKPIATHLWPGQMPALVAEKVFEILQAMECGEEIEGDILGFLHGERPIEEACKRIRELVEEDDRLVGRVDVFPLYTKLPQEQQDAALREKEDPSHRRVVISTNVAETSLTVEGIVHVVDSGLINEPNWDPATQTTIVTPTVHSQAGCRQRWGRSGRVQRGVVHCLYTEEQFAEFPPYTLPEIRRAPLEQIVLTAKVAGVDDIVNFDWIERPSIEELERSSQALVQRGALDGDGDLTEHGLELRGFMDAPDIANLMVLADRFACAVEMATLLAMMKAGGRRALLRWNRDWDATTKRSVNQIHQGLVGPCQDDVEFYLKLYEAWAGDPEDEDHKPAEWARANCVNHRVLKDKVKPERDKLLQPLTGHKKYDERRHINFDLLTRLRMVLVYGLPDRVYALDDLPEPAMLPSPDKPLYRPFVADHAGAGQSATPSSDVWVEISPESVCHGKTVEAFACLQRQSVRRRLSPQAEPVTVIYASVLTLIKREWLSCVGKSMFALARMMAQETRDERGELRLTADRARLFLDQAYPVGSVFACQSLDGADDSQQPLVLLGKRLAAPPPVIEVTRDEEVDDTPDVEEEEAETGLAEEAKVEEDKLAALVVEEEEEAVPPWADLVEELMEESEGEGSGLQAMALTDEAGRTVQATGKLRLNGQQEVPDGPFAVVVEGFDFSDLQHPTVGVRLPHSTDPFQLFTDKYQEGAEVDVTVRAVERYPNDYLTYLLAEHPETGLEIMMEPGDISLIGRNFTVERLKPGDTFRAIVERIDVDRRRVRITRLKYAEEDFLRFMGRQRERVVDGVIAEVRDNGLYVLLDPEDASRTVPLGAFAGVRYLPPRPEATMLGKPCRVKVRFNGKRTWRRQLPLLPDGLVELLDRRTWGDHITADQESRLLEVVGRMTYHERMTLAAQSADTGYRRVVNWLYRRSNGLLADVVDIEALTVIEQAQQRNERLRGEIVKIMDFGAFVELESGVQGLVRTDEIGWEPGAKDSVYEGQSVEVLVKDVDPDRARVEFTMKSPEADPWHNYDIGMVVTGTVTGIQDYGAFVELESGVSGLIHRDELSWTRVMRVEDVVAVSEKVTVKIIEKDDAERKLALSRRLEEEKPEVRFAVGSWYKGTVVNIEDYGAFVEIARGVTGLAPLRQLSYDHVKHPSDAVSEGHRVRAQVTKIKTNGRFYQIEFSLKDPDANPYRHYRPGMRLQGVVHNIQDFGAFVQLDSGGTGLIPIRELSWTHVNHPKDVVSVGERLQVEVVSVNPEKEELALSKKALEPDPYSHYEVGMRLQGTVARVRDFGAFVALEPGVEGLLHNSEITWGDNGVRAKDKFHLGTQIVVRVIQVDRRERKIGLSLKRVHEGTAVIPSDKIGLLIGPGGKTIQGLQKRYDAGIEVKENGSITIQAAEESRVQAVRREIQDLVSVYRDTMTIPPEMVGRLIGKRGATVKRLMKETGAHIGVDNSGLVTIEGRNPWEVDAAKRKIRETVPTVQATLIIPATKIGLLIGRGGATIKQLKRDTDTDISVEKKTITKQGLIFTSKEEVGAVTIWGTSEAKVNAAINAIRRLIPEAR